MKTRFLVKVYKIEDVKEYADGGLDDIDEQTEDQLVETRDFQYSRQGDSLRELAYRWASNHEHFQIKAEIDLGEAVVKWFKEQPCDTVDRAKLIDFFQRKVDGRKEMLRLLENPTSREP